MVWYGMVWYGMVWYGMVWYGMVWYVVPCMPSCGIALEGRKAACAFLWGDLSVLRVAIWLVGADLAPSGKSLTAG